VTAFAADRSGATAMEYGLMITMLTVALMTVIGLVGDSISSLFTQLVADMDSEGI